MLVYVNKGTGYTLCVSLARNTQIPTIYTLTRRMFFIALSFQSKILITKTSSDIFSSFSAYVVDLHASV